MTISITQVVARDIRFPTSRLLDGSDAMNPNPDYSAAYVILHTNQPGLEGHGLTFTIGRGTEGCVAAINALAPLMLAAKFGVPVCPHAGGVGLCEYVQHIAMFDYIAVSASLEDRVLEYVDHLHEHFMEPVRMVNGRYMPPTQPGYSIEMRRESLEEFAFPGGSVWQGVR